jgi:biotin transporter BioY
MYRVPSDITLIDAVSSRPESTDVAIAIRAASVVLFAALTAAAAQISIPLPFTDVPFTFQPMVVLIGGLALGPRLGLLSQVIYLMAGIAGLPVFAASPALPPGIARLGGPTAGYLMSYPIAAVVTGYVGARGFDRRYVTSLAAMLAGLAVVFACGVLWLTALTGFRAALVMGFYPFVISDIVKMLAAAAVMPGVWRMLGSIPPAVGRESQ